MKDIFRVLRTLQVNSEKAQILTEKNNEYVFKVDRKANKLEIKRAVTEIFGKKVVSVRTANYRGKKKRGKRREVQSHFISLSDISFEIPFSRGHMWPESTLNFQLW